jgi:hypothetical protein
MPTAQEFEQAALAAVAQFPTVAAFVQAGDPRVLAQIRARAAMHAMMSEQIDAAMYEPFVKVRDSTVLADATLKGILPLARACRVYLSVKNGDAVSFALAAGRRLTDPKGRIYQVESGVSIAAGATVLVACSQLTTRIISHTIVAPTPFYRFEIVQTDADVYLNTLGVWLSAQEFTYAPDWCNVVINVFNYQVETDEQRRLFVQFGAKDIVGYGVQIGDVFEFRLTECEGKINDLKPADTFGLEYVYTPADGKLVATLDSVIDEGASPPTMADLRVMSEYPSIYDHSAAYLGEFEMLLRRYLSGVTFLSVWNEQIEEVVRGPSDVNINRLFVSGIVDGMSDAAFQARATDLINRADNGFNLTFIPAVLAPVAISIVGRVSVVHDPATVEAQIRAAILGKYGMGQPDVSRGQSTPIRNQPINTLLKTAVPAFQDEKADFTVTITISDSLMPEEFLYIAPDSMTVAIERADFNTGLWTY